MAPGEEGNLSLKAFGEAAGSSHAQKGSKRSRLLLSRRGVTRG